MGRAEQQRVRKQGLDESIKRLSIQSPILFACEVAHRRQTNHVLCSWFIKQRNCHKSIALFPPHLHTVPDPPQNLMDIEYGTRNINVRWDPPTIHFNSLIDTLRGSVDNLTYYVRVGEQEIATNVTEVNLTSADGLLPGTQYTIQVCTYVYCGICVHAFIIKWVPPECNCGQMCQPHQQ